MHIIMNYGFVLSGVYLNLNTTSHSFILRSITFERYERLKVNKNRAMGPSYQLREQLVLFYRFQQVLAPVLSF